MQSDPYAYIRRIRNNLEILKVWVDDLLLFASPKGIMVRFTEELSTTFDVTDLGEPSKIIRIEIS